MKKVLVLCGPTASGKTKLSICISRLLNCEIINADSRQIYNYLNIGTAKPTLDERKHVKHYFVDIVNPDEHYDAGIFGEQGRRKVEEIFQRKKIPLIVGGSGLYIQSLIDGLFEGPKRDYKIRKELELRIEKEGIGMLYDELKKIDPEAAQKTDPTKKRRIIRDLEVYYLTHTPISKLQKENLIEIDFKPFIWGLTWERDVLYHRVNSRTDEMIRSGLVEETCNLLSMGYDRSLNSLQTVGYKECISFLENKIKYQEMIELIKQNTRHYVKRQLTWFNRDKRIKWIHIESESEFEKYAEDIVKDFLDFC
jgi:tRNA dimethylallyltransferase